MGSATLRNATLTAVIVKTQQKKYPHAKRQHQIVWKNGLLMENALVIAIMKLVSSTKVIVLKNCHQLAKGLIRSAHVNGLGMENVTLNVTQKYVHGIGATANPRYHCASYPTLTARVTGLGMANATLNA